ncbi:MAG: NAD(P)-binding domain-containing protein [Deltaproteobacteria bacterium]
MEVVVGFGVLMLGLILLWGVRSLRGQRELESQSRENLSHAERSGALPPSLHPKVNLDVCIGTGACVKVCPEVDVLGLIDGKARLANPTKCIGHGECLRACPVDAIELVIGNERRGVDIPLVSSEFETNVPNLYVVGELGGMGLIYNAMTQALQCMRAVKRAVPKKQEGVHQLVIVGAGPAGLAASLAAIEAKLDYVTVDQESMGGTVLQYPRQKIVMSRPVQLPIYGKLAITTVSKEDLLAQWEDIVTKTGVRVRNQVRVDGVKKGDDGIFEVATSQGTLRANVVLLAMGRRGTPRKLGVPGEDLPKVTYRLLEPENYAGSRCLVVGGGDSAVEAAIALGEAGATVHLSYRGSAFGRIKPKNQERLDAAVGAGKVALMMETNTKAITKDAVTLDDGGRSIELPNDYVLVFAGGVLPTKFLQAAGVEVQTFKGEAFAPANT